MELLVASQRKGLRRASSIMVTIGTFDDSQDILFFFHNNDKNHKVSKRCFEIKHSLHVLINGK